MKKIISKIILILILFILLMEVNSMATVIISTDKQVETDSGNVTISVTSKQALGAYTLKLTDAAGLTLVSASAGDGQVSSDNKTITGSSASGTTSLGSFTFKVPSVTEDKKYNIKFSVTGMETPNLDSIANETNTAVLTVKAKVQTPPQTKPETPSNSGNTATTNNNKQQTVTEPKFTSANKTMYAIGDINLRSSWSTSSSATQVTKGTELKVTGTSTEKVNGYVWYRVTYNGATKYVASSLLTNTKPEDTKKSDNAYLKSLTIEGQELIPEFSKDTTSYAMQIGNDITELNIKAEAEDSKATVEIQGNKDLKEGENTVTISVNAEDNTIKIYEVTVTKSEKIALGLKSLTIEGTNISSSFKPEVYEYEIDIEDKGIIKLEIEAIANDEKATVEIIGNEDLIEGENTITIMVSSQDGKEKVTYQITANKVIKEVATPVTEENKPIVPKMYLYIALGGLVLIVLIIVVIHKIKNRNKDEYEFSDNFNNFDEEYPEDLPERNVNNILYTNNNIEDTQEINIDNEEIDKFQDRKAKLDYFLNDIDNDDNYYNDDERRRSRRGKHF